MLELIVAASVPPVAIFLYNGLIDTLLSGIVILYLLLTIEVVGHRVLDDALYWYTVSIIQLALRLYFFSGEAGAQICISYS